MFAPSMMLKSHAGPPLAECRCDVIPVWAPPLPYYYRPYMTLSHPPHHRTYSIPLEDYNGAPYVIYWVRLTGHSPLRGCTTRTSPVMAAAYILPLDLSNVSQSTIKNGRTPYVVPRGSPHGQG